MFKVEDIMAELETGKSIEDIAREATVKLNEAQEKYRVQQEEKKKAEALALQKRAKKEERANSIVHEIFNYLNDFHPTFLTPADMAILQKHFDVSKFVNTIDEFIKEVEKVPAVEAEMRKNPGKVTVKLNEEESKQVEDAISKFLCENNLF